MMQVIPVIDLLNGEVVHAKKGQRQDYQSLQSELCSSSDPLTVVAALLAVHPFKQLYIADLNAIQKLPYKTSTNFAVIARIISAYPQLEVWLDAGITKAADTQLWQPLNLNFILASESLATMADFYKLSRQLGNFILSLDFFSDGFHGPQALLSHTDLWPQRVII
ncbi:MAG: nickel transporter, partial [Methylotenera sp.]|nr:nickel transporter [Methylotenera sp.]